MPATASLARPLPVFVLGERATGRAGGRGRLPAASTAAAVAAAAPWKADYGGDRGSQLAELTLHEDFYHDIWAVAAADAGAWSKVA